MTTDTDNALRLVAMYGDRIRFCHDWGAWLLYDGTKWVVDPAENIRQAAINVTNDMLDEANTTNDAKLAGWAIRSRSVNRLEAMVKVARSAAGIPVVAADLDADPWALNVLNGTVDLRTGAIRPSDPHDLITKQAQVLYDPAAKCPRWEAFIQWALPEPAEAAFLQRALGLALTGDVSDRALFIIQGGTGSGKSTILEAMKDILGDYATTTPTETLMKRRMDVGATPDIARLKGARFVTASESEENQELASAKLKSLTGGKDTITARALYKAPFEFRPNFKLFLATNFKPAVNAADGALWDRLKLIELKNQISDGARDNRLHDKLIAEASGILNWCLEGLAAWHREGLSPPASIKAAIAAYRVESDWLDQFREDRLEFEDPDDYSDPDFEPYRTTMRAMRAEYTFWCRDNDEDMVNSRIFNDALRQRLGPEKMSNGVRYWAGVRIIDRKAQTEKLHGTINI
jgi:putative DNA primase/helicase